MRKTFRVDFNHIGDIAGGPDFESWMSDRGKNFADQTADITVETVEEKSILRCNTMGCAKPAKWWILHDGFGPCKRCENHLQDCLLDKPHDYHIKPIPPVPPEPVVVEWEEDHRYFAYSVVTVPKELRNKRFMIRFEEKQ